MSLADFELINKLGAYSSVYHVRRKHDRQEYALKKVKMADLSDKQKQNALNQVRLLASVKHPNIVAYRQAFLDQSSSSLCIIMEYANDGDVFQLISAHKKKKQYINQETIWNIIIQVIHGLRELHRHKILHRDMKCANIFLSKDSKAKLGDMNVSKIAKRGLLQTQTGTPYYASPQVWNQKPYNHKSDIWSLGCVLYQMCALKPPFRAQDMQGLYKKVNKGAIQKIPQIYSQQMFSLIKEMLIVNPSRRPSCDTLLQNQFIRSKDPFSSMSQSNSVMIKTIKMPRNLYYLTDVLPHPNYQNLRSENRRAQRTQNSISSTQQSILGNESLPRIRRYDLKIKAQQQQRQKLIQMQKQRQRLKQKQKQRQKQQKRSYDVLLRQRKKRMRDELSKKKMEIRAIYGKKQIKQGLRIQGHRVSQDRSRQSNRNVLLPSLIK